jgi:hypothetical protein
MDRPAPIVEYARKVGKSTADFTATDLSKFMSWWMKQPVRKDILNMAKKYTLAQFQQAHKTRLAEQGIESPINDGKEEIVIHKDEVVCSMELTKQDVEALLFSIERTFADYEMEEDHPHTISLLELKEGLEGV